MIKLNLPAIRRISAGLFTLLLAGAYSANARAEDVPPAAADHPVVYQLNLAGVHSPDPGPWHVSIVPGANGVTRTCFTATGLGYDHFVVVAGHRLRGGHDYMAELHYEVVTAPQFPHSFYLFARSKTLGNDADIWCSWLGEPGNARRIEGATFPAQDGRRLDALRGLSGSVLGDYRSVSSDRRFWAT